MQSSSKPLYVRLPVSDADRLSEVAASTGKSKRQLVSEAVRGHLEEEALTVGRVELRESAPEVMTLPELALLLRLEEAKLEEATRRGELPGRLIAGEWRYSRAAVIEWLGAAPSEPA